MKACPVLILALALTSSLAVAEEERGVLIDDGAFQSGYTSIGAKTGKAFGGYRSFVTAAGGWNVDHALTLGLKGDVLTGSAAPVDVLDAERGSLTYVGVFAETLPWRLGIGTVKLGVTLGTGDVGYRVNDVYEHDSFGFGEVEAVGLLHLTHRVDLALTVGARMTGTPDLEGLAAADLRGATASLGFRGWF